MGGQHLSVVHNLALVRGDLQRSQNIIHSRNAGGCASWGAVEAPLEDVQARPTCYVGSLINRGDHQDQLSCFDAKVSNMEINSADQHLLSHLYALALIAGECPFNHAIVLPQHPALVYHLDVNSSDGREGVGSQGVLLRHLRSPPGVVDGENNISFRYIKVPGDDWGGLSDLNHHLQEDVRRLETQNWEQQAINKQVALTASPQ